MKELEQIIGKGILERLKQDYSNYQEWLQTNNEQFNNQTPLQYYQDKGPVAFTRRLTEIEYNIQNKLS